MNLQAVVTSGLLCRVMLCAGVDGVGPPETCIRICREWPALGRPTVIYATRRKAGGLEGLVQSVIPYRLSFLPTYLSSTWAVSAAARACLAGIEEGDLVYVWPTAPIRYVEEAKTRGARVLVENINTYTGYAKKIIDAASERIGAPPQHRIDAALIAEERQRLAMADFVFAPNRFVEESLSDPALGTFAILPTSYGAYLPKHVDFRGARGSSKPREGGGLNVLFVGSVCVRKGAHRLLEAWDAARIPGTLTLCGVIDPFIAERYAGVLSGDRIRCPGFTRQVNDFYADADIFIFPSLEEGGPQVCYEAAAFGLPQITTAMGGGRIAEEGRNALIVEPDSTEALVEALHRLAQDAELCRELGANARVDAERFSWPNVARQRHNILIEYGT